MLTNQNPDPTQASTHARCTETPNPPPGHVGLAPFVSKISERRCRAARCSQLRPGHGAVLRVRPRPRRALAPLRPASRAPCLPRAAAGRGGPSGSASRAAVSLRRGRPAWAGAGWRAVRRRRELSPWAHGLGGSRGPACGAPCRARLPGHLRPRVPRSAQGRGLPRSVPRPLRRSPSRRRHDPLPQ